MFNTLHFDYYVKYYNSNINCIVWYHGKHYNDKRQDFDYEFIDVHNRPIIMTKEGCELYITKK